MAKRYRRKVLLIKEEAAAGVAEGLAAADAVLAVNIEVTPLAGDSVSRELERPYYGGQQEIPSNTHSQIAFGVEIAGSGSVETPPAWGRLLKACGMSESVAAEPTAYADNTAYDVGDRVTDAGKTWRALAAVPANNSDNPAEGAVWTEDDRASGVHYTPVSSDEKTVTIGINIDGVLQTLPGCRGTFSANLTNGQVPRFAFTFTGKHGAPGDMAAVANPDLSDWKTPLLPSNLNSPTFELFGVDSLALSALTLDWGAEVVHSERIGLAASVDIVNRASSGQLTYDTPAMATFNAEAKARAGENGALKLVHGRVEGNIVQIDMPSISLSQPSYQDANGVWQTQVNYAALPVDGHDELSIVAR